MLLYRTVEYVNSAQRMARKLELDILYAMHESLNRSFTVTKK